MTFPGPALVNSSLRLSWCINSLTFSLAVIPGPLERKTDQTPGFFNTSLLCGWALERVSVQENKLIHII